MAKENSVRVNLYINSSVLAKIDAFAEELGISRSAAVSVISREFFKTEEAAEAMAMMNEMKEVFLNAQLMK